MPVEAETERLRLRGWREGDRESFVHHLNRPAVMRWLGGVQDEATSTAAFDRIDGFQRDYGHTFWVVERKSDNELLGFCGIKRVNSPGAGDLTGVHEIGWRLREDAWGRGYAKEAAVASLDVAFGRLRAPKVVALTVAGNAPSWGLMERLGMKRSEDCDFRDDRFGDELNPTLVWEIEAGDWPEARQRALGGR